MTDDQANFLGKYAKELLPRTTDRQAALFAEAVTPFDFDAAKAAVKQHALANEDERLNLPRVMDGIRARSDVPAKERQIRALEAELAHQRDEDRARAAAARELSQALAFCAAHAGDVEGWRRQIVERSPFVAKRAAGRATAELNWLACLIFKEFGDARARGFNPGVDGGPRAPRDRAKGERRRGWVAATPGDPGRAIAPTPPARRHG